MGVKFIDVLYMVSVEKGGCDYFLVCDDWLFCCYYGKVKVLNLVSFILLLIEGEWWILRFLRNKMW